MTTPPQEYLCTNEEINSDDSVFFGFLPWRHTTWHHILEPKMFITYETNKQSHNIVVYENTQMFASNKNGS